MTDPLKTLDIVFPPFIRRLRWHSEYEDLLQECRLQILAAAGNYDPERGAWYAFAAWQCRPALRRWRNGAHRDPPPPVGSLDALADDGETPIVDLIADPRQSPEIEVLDRVEREQALSSIRDPRRRRAFLLRIDGKTWREIGERIGVSHEGARLIVRAAVREAQGQGAI